MDTLDWSQAWDDVIGEKLDAGKVLEARREDVGYIEEMKVWRKISRAEAQRRGYKVIQVRWIDINKGDKAHPFYRSRLVGKDFNDGAGDGLFASTPPLEALRLLISDVATEDMPGDKIEKVIMINDVSRAFFEAPMRRYLRAEIPEEAKSKEDKEDDNVALLQMSLYDTRDAAANFQAEVAKFMSSCGFTRGRYDVNIYYHKGRKLRTLVQGDDFVTSGRRSQTMWFRQELQKRFKMKKKVICRGEGELTEGTVLNRTIRTSQGWEYEADQRHADILVKEMNLENANGVKTPGEELKPLLDADEEMKLEGKAASKYRALLARSNYLAADRADVEYATKEVCKGMSALTKSDERKLRRMVRYLVDRRRVVSVFNFQQAGHDLKEYSDSDWAGCRRTANSTSGGAVLRGGHCLKTWSSTQKNITLSSGEAELVAAVKMSTQLIGLLQLADYWGMKMEGHVYVDPSAALGIVKRQGCGKMRHVRAGMLWIQQKEEDGELSYNKVLGAEKPGDLMTKHLGQAVIHKHMKTINQEFRKGRAESGLKIS